MATPPTTPTVTPLQSPAQFARRLIDLFPPGWASEDARTPGGILYGVMETIGSQLSFELGAPITQLVTIGGTPQAFDHVTLTFAGNNFQGSRTIDHIVQIGETLKDIANALAYGISSDPVLSFLGVNTTVAGSIISVNYPNIPPVQTWTTQPPVPNAFTILATVSPGATETVTLGTGTASVTGSLQYAWAATRIQTAEGNALDLASADYFGDALPRIGGEPDGSFRTRILVALANLGQGATRQAVTNAIQAVTGAPPRVVEPWSPGDTGVLDGLPGAGMMFWDVDTAITPGRITDPGLAYQGFVDTIIPPLPALGGNPLPCLDDGLYYDIAGSSYFDFLGGVALGAQAVYDAINKTKVFGTVVWVRFGPGIGSFLLDDNGNILLDDNGNPLTWP